MNRVLVLGNATLDLVQRVAQFPAVGETVLADEIVRCPGGKGLNQAVAAARTGAQTRLVAPIGRDGEGEFLTRFIQGEAGLEACWLLCNTPTDLSTIWVDGRGENMIVSSAFCARSTTVDQARSACAVLKDGDVLLMQGNLPPEVTQVAARMAREARAITILNTAPIAWDMQPVLGLFDIVVANELEAALLSGTQGDGAASDLNERGVRTAVVTLGARGAMIASEKLSMRISAPRVDAIDTSGAGDVMVGTFAGLLAQGVGIDEAAETAVHAASLSVTRVGTTASFPSGAEMSALRAQVNQTRKETTRDA
jgi:ribokinase